ncbi:hypothetical protein BGAL_0222g00190 [Botrytis galanthina]|uniref:Uncharacterized protein n=1 Tax=Botrytis galanthina TaxID=278940 RepID=A0A4S8R430_9HELO|nr:hypothetical protein BGAL_0222g00190 [Botrytis galanthina]
MENIPEAKVKKNQISTMDKDSTIPVDMNPDVEMWLSKIHALTMTRLENFQKLADINVAREDAHVKYRILIVSIIIWPASRILMLKSCLFEEDNLANFKKDFPNASRALLAEFQKAASENTVLDDLNIARKKQEIVYIACRNELREMNKIFNNLFPEYIPQDVQHPSVTSFPATDFERILIFFRTCSPENVAREVFTHKALPGFKIYSCEKSSNRDDLPPSYRAQVESARRIPDDPDRFISYDTPAVTERMRNPERRKAKDVFTATLETVWVYDPRCKKYGPRLCQQVFHKYSADEDNDLTRRMMVYVEISIVDVE